MFRDHSLTSNSHRALIALGSLSILTLSFSLFVGWFHYFKERAHREMVIKMAETATQRSSLMAAQRAGDSEALVPGMVISSGDSDKATTLQEIGKDDVRVDPLAMVRMAEPVAQSQIEAANKVVQSFLKASNWTDKVPLVHNPARARLLLQIYYETQKNKDPECGAYIRSDRYRISGQELLAMAYAGSSKDSEVTINMVKEADASYSIDWESFVGWGEMTFADFKNARPATAKLMRVNARIDDNYKGEFSDPASYVVFELISPDGLSALHGFSDKHSPLTESLLRSAAGDGLTKLTLSLQFPADAQSNDSARIAGLVADRWLVLR